VARNLPVTNQHEISPTLLPTLEASAADILTMLRQTYKPHSKTILQQIIIVHLIRILPVTNQHEISPNRLPTLEASAADILTMLRQTIQKTTSPTTRFSMPVTNQHEISRTRRPPKRDSAADMFTMLRQT